MSTFILRVAVEIVRHDCMSFVMLQVWFVACESMHVMRCLYLDQKLYSCLFFGGGGHFFRLRLSDLYQNETFSPC